ncbi:hypothetical protein OQA88_4435 [Cercophora sp. LCS_1]
MASSADIYTAPSETSYLLLQPFDMPTSSGSIWAVAFSSNSGALVTAALSVMLTISFLCFWNLVCFIALLSSNEKTRRRYAALVVLWNSNDPWFAFNKLCYYTYHYWSDTPNFRFGFLWTLVCLIVFGGSLALSVVGPSLVQIGNAAPVRPEITFYPVNPRAGDSSGLLKVFGLRASSYLRALGSVEAADVTKRKDVLVSTDKQLPPHGSEPMTRLNYSYSIKGNEFGLQHGSELSLAVNGSCITEYEWDDGGNEADADTYHLWGNSSRPFTVPLDSVSLRSAPRASFLYHSDFQRQYDDNGNLSFAAIVWSAHRASIGSSQDDPWYATEKGAQDYPVPFNAQFWVKRKRPALSCWQQDRWRYGEHETKNVFGLRELPNMKIPAALLDVLEVAVAVPMLVTLGNACGDSALRSRTTSPNGVIDASASSIKSDLERLILASYVATQSVFLDTTMFQHDGNWDNLLQGADKRPLAGAGDFVIVSPEIQTFSMVGLIVIGVVLGFLLIVESGITTLIRLHGQDNSNPDKRLIRFKVLSAPALFRRIYELGSGGPVRDADQNNPEKQGQVVTQKQADGENGGANKWVCDEGYPEPDDEIAFTLDKCSGWSGLEAGRKRCRGHISVPRVPNPPNPEPEGPPTTGNKE